MIVYELLGDVNLCYKINNSNFFLFFKNYS